MGMSLSGPSSSPSSPKKLAPPSRISVIIAKERGKMGHCILDLQCAWHFFSHSIDQSQSHGHISLQGSGDVQTWWLSGGDELIKLVSSNHIHTHPPLGFLLCEGIALLIVLANFRQDFLVAIAKTITIEHWNTQFSNQKSIPSMNSMSSKTSFK